VVAAAAHHGTLGGNLARDLGGALWGAIPATVEAAIKLPEAFFSDQWRYLHGRKGGKLWEQAVVPLAKSEAYQYSPLVHGNVHEFYRRFHAHPLMPIFDLLAVATGGVSRLAAVPLTARALEAGIKAGEITAAEARALKTEAVLTGRYKGPLQTITAYGSHGGEPTIVRTLPRRGAQAARMLATDKLLKNIVGPERAIVGEFARAARADKRLAGDTYLKHRLNDVFADYQKAFRGLNKYERVAEDLISMGFQRKDVEAWARALPDTAVGRDTRRLILHEKVLEAFDDPSDRLLAANEAGRAVADLREEIETRLGNLSPETAATSVWRHLRRIRGAEFVEPTPAKLGKIGQRHEAHRAYTTRLEGLTERAVGRVQKIHEPQPSVAHLTGDVPLRGYWTAAQRRRIGQIIPPSSREAEVQASIDALNKQIRQLEKALPADSPQILDAIKHRTAWQRLANLAGDMGNIADKARSEVGALNLTGDVAIPSIEEMQRTIEELTAKIQGSRASSADLRKDINKLSNQLQKLRRERKQLELGSRQLEDGRVILGNGTMLHPRGWHRAEQLAGALSVARDKLEKMDAAAAKRVEPTGLVGGPTIDELRAELEAAGRPQPYYKPDMMAKDHAPGIPQRGKGGGLTPHASDVHQSHLTLFDLGELALHTDKLTPAFLRSMNHDYMADLHTRARERAYAVPKANEGLPGGGLPAGYRWLRERRGERIPTTLTGEGEHQAAFARAFPDISEYEPLTLKQKPGEDLAEVEQIALDEQGRRLAVPNSYANVLQGESRLVNSALRRIVEHPLEVWRKLVLHLRIPWLENNFVGNAILWTLRFAGVDGLRAVLAVIHDTKGVQGVRKALGMPELKKSLSSQDIRELMPTQSEAGTFWGTQLPGETWAGRALEKLPGGEAAYKAGTGPLNPFRWLPKLDKKVETGLRRLGVNAVLLGSDEVKAIYKAMPRETRNWRDAMRKGLENPAEKELAGREVNDALGNFLSLSEVEQSTLRTLIPFWAWYREITRIALKFPFDHPVRIAIYAKLAQLQENAQSDQLGSLPTYLRGIVPLGAPKGDQQLVLSLQSANPFQTVAQLGIAAGAAAGIGPHTKAGRDTFMNMWNPFLATPMAWAGGKATPGQRGPEPGLLQYFGKNFLGNLPEMRLIPGVPPALGGRPPESRLYPTRSSLDMLLAFLGYPVRDINLQQAHYYAGRGD